MDMGQGNHVLTKASPESIRAGKHGESLASDIRAAHRAHEPNADVLSGVYP